MKESARIAATVARQKLKSIDPKNQFFNGGNLHLHVPEVSPVSAAELKII